MRSPSTHDRTLTDYGPIVGSDRIRHIQTLADNLSETRVLHVNSAASGGGVAELLRSLVPLFMDVGVETDWFVMDAGESFFDVTKSLHNGLQGDEITLTDEMKATYRTVTERNATAVTNAYDIIVLHDPQPLGMISFLKDRYPDTTFVWRCHLDVTSPARSILEFVSDYVRRFDHVVFSRAAYGREVAGPASTVIHPAIDPLGEKNRRLDQAEAAIERNRLEADGLSFDVPVVTQVSRFDPWKDHSGVIDAFRRIKTIVPNARLVLVGGMADDDPEGVEIYDRTVAKVSDDTDVHVLTDLPDTTVNFLQRHADVVVQKSLREGFGLVVSEALWKRTPVIGSNVGGIPLQIADAENGYLVEPTDLETVSDRMIRLLTDGSLRQQLGNHGRMTIRKQFLLPRQLADCLELFGELRDTV
ncbi:glycosyltransferase [Natronorubrum halophilum]|uniref:glycosyltransferase n=1 Tax=Natronorubrum halophilum TaxID=1702106 RepID=UPI000EF67DE9|nr:glycosyltransferase [Natronorubrum halophilum]